MPWKNIEPISSDYVLPMSSDRTDGLLVGKEFGAIAIEGGFIESEVGANHEVFSLLVRSLTSWSFSRGLEYG